MKSIRTTQRSRTDHILCESPRVRRRAALPYAVVVAAAFVCSASARAGTDILGAGRLTATGAVTAIDGSAGGGINPWAVIAGYGTNRQIGGSAFYTHLTLPNFQLNAYGAAIGLFDRVELSYARQDFSLGNTGAQRDGAIAGFFGAPVSGLPAPLQFGANDTVSQDVIGLKVRLFGNSVLDPGDSDAGGIGGGSLPSERQLSDHSGARPNGSTFYVSASKRYLDGLFGRYPFIDLNLNFTATNQNGRLGFGGLGRNGAFRARRRRQPNE